MTPFELVGVLVALWVAALTARILGWQRVPRRLLFWTLPFFVFGLSMLLYSQISLGRQAVYLGCVGLSWQQCRELLGPPLGNREAFPPALPEAERQGRCYLYHPGGRLDSGMYCVVVDPGTERVKAVVELYGY